MFQLRSLRISLSYPNQRQSSSLRPQPWRWKALIKAEKEASFFRALRQLCLPVTSLHSALTSMCTKSTERWTMGRYTQNVLKPLRDMYCDYLSQLSALNGRREPRHCSHDVPTGHEQCFGGRTQKAARHPKSRKVRSCNIKEEQHRLWHCARFRWVRMSWLSYMSSRFPKIYYGFCNLWCKSPLRHLHQLQADSGSIWNLTTSNCSQPKMNTTIDSRQSLIEQIMIKQLHNIFPGIFVVRPPWIPHDKLFH